MRFLVQLSKLLAYFIFETRFISSVLVFSENWCSIPVVKENKRNLPQELLTIENSDLDLKVHALHCANELLVRVRLSFINFSRHATQAETIRNHHKQVLVKIKYCLRRYQSSVFSC